MTGYRGQEQTEGGKVAGMGRKALMKDEMSARRDEHKQSEEEVACYRVEKSSEDGFNL